MNARLIKETRDLLPVFAGTLLLIVVPQLIWQAAGFGCFALGVACVVLAGSSFGNEFQHRTLSLLLSQPIPRSVLWRDKMLVLGAALVASVAALLVCLAVHRPQTESTEWLVLLFLPLCAFCGAPFWTLSLRHGIGGMVAAVSAPGSILATLLLINELLGREVTDQLFAVCVVLLLFYCALVYGLGYARFKRLEVVDKPARELALPARLETILVAPLTRVSARFQGPFATLLKKEFRLQQTSFLLTGVFLLIAVAAFCLTQRRPDVAVGILGGDIGVYVLIMPLIAGAISVAEERGWGMAEWHLTLPPSALKQWSAKMLVALSTALGLGLLLPTAMGLAGAALLGRLNPGVPVLPVAQILCWLIGSLLLTSVAVYGASICGNTLRGILTAMVMVVAGCALTAWVVNRVVRLAANQLAVGRMSYGPRHELANQVQAMVPVLLSLGLLLMVCVVQWFAWSNFRHFRPSARSVGTQLAAIYGALGLLALGIPLVIALALLRHGSG